MLTMPHVGYLGNSIVRAMREWTLSLTSDQIHRWGILCYLVSTSNHGRGSHRRQTPSRPMPSTRNIQRQWRRWKNIGNLASQEMSRDVKRCQEAAEWRTFLWGCLATATWGKMSRLVTCLNRDRAEIAELSLMKLLQLFLGGFSCAMRNQPLWPLGWPGVGVFEWDDEMSTLAPE